MHSLYDVSVQADRLDVLSVGEVLVDFVAPDADGLAGAEEFFAAPGGAPANVAVAVARLGGSSAFAGAVGDDPFGNFLAKLLQRERVDTRSLRFVPSRTTLAFVARNTGGIPDFLFYRGADVELQPDDIPIAQILRSTFVYVSSMALMSQPSASATQYAAEAAREGGVLVAIDPNLRPASWPSLPEARDAILPLMRTADILKVNDEEARILAETPDLDQAMNRLAGDKVLLVVTLGSQGCRWQWGDKSGSIAAPTVTVRETTGAGDAFMGALLYRLSRLKFSPGSSLPMDVAELEVALRFACAAGASACTKLGAMAALPSSEGVQTILDSA